MFPEKDIKNPYGMPNFCFVMIMELGDMTLDQEMDKRLRAN